MTYKSVRSLALGALLLCTPAAALGQDLIARQAPVDRKAKAVDTLTISRLVSEENITNPGGDLYTSWVTSRIFCYSDKDVPETYKIDLRGFHMPTPSRKINSKFGYRPKFKRMHKGLDIKVYTGDTVYAAFSGRVRVSDYQPSGYGHVVCLRHNNGLETIYGHFSKRLVQAGEYVKAGQPIGLGGNTGRSFGSHLHFETRICGQAIDPALLFDFPNQDVTCDYYVFHKNGKGVAGSKTLAANRPAMEERPSVASAAPSTDLVGKFHKVTAGETVASVARKLNISVETLCQANNISRTSHIRPGQILRY